MPRPTTTQELRAVPLSGRPAAWYRPPTFLEESVDPQSTRVLVVDDEADIRGLVAAILEEAGYQVEQAPGGRAAIDRIRSAPPHLVLLDLHMPEVDGKEVVRRLADLPAPPPILILTGMSSVDLVPLHPFVAGFLTKPFRVEVLLRTCADILAAQPPAAVTERRRVPRRRITLDATILSREGTPVALGRLVDVSVAGAQLDLGAPLLPGHAVTLALQVPGVEQPVAVEAKVVWRDSSKVGVTFAGLTAEQERRLSELLTDRPHG
jgi:CheY-like chemotaxis protein